MTTSQPAYSRVLRIQAPPLENGDRLTRVEFERRYSLMPRVKKAELVEGIVYMAHRCGLDFMQNLMAI